jgi:sugar phosphate isomerase/epimerase
MTFGIHNHWWEFLRVGDRYAYQIAMDHLVPGVFFEVDTYWVQTAGVDPATVVRELGARAPLLHIKDGACQRGQPMTAVGDGVIDFAGIVAASGDVVEWMIVELDSCAGDMMEAVAKSCAYLTREGLADGK